MATLNGETSPNLVLERLQGRRVRLWSMNAVQDEGVLEACDPPWLLLRKDGDKLLCFCIYNIRLIEPLTDPRDGHIAPT
jgi:hypothetical protein